MTINEPAQAILILIAYAQRPRLTPMLAYLDGLDILLGKSHDLQPCFGCASNVGSDEPVNFQVLAPI